MTMDNSTNSTADIYNQVLILLSRSWREEPIRNIGVRLSDLTDEKQVIIDEMGGSIHVTSVVDYGSVFTITLPLS